MRFKPHIIEADAAPLDEEGELMLSEDLLSLGEQLTAEASQLANCYPPEEDRAAASDGRFVEKTAADPVGGGENRGTRAAPWRRRLVTSSAALVSLALLLALVTAHFIGDTGSHPRDQASGRSGELASANPKSANLESSAVGRAGNEVSDHRENPTASPQDAGATIDHGDLSPIMFLNEVSAPELEGWYDLNEQQDSDDADLSI